MGKVVPFKSRNGVEDKNNKSSTPPENRFDSQAQQIYSSADTTLNEGRNCVKCGERKKWSEFDRKSRGINGRDSRCKPCISEAKVIAYRAKVKKQERDRGLLFIVRKL